MKSVVLVFLAAFVAMACAVGQYYVPRAYYLIDSEGHQTPPVPLRRLRRSLGPLRPLPMVGPSWNPGNQDGASARANANANAWSNGGDASATANANANARANSGSGGWSLPYPGQYGAANPNAVGLSAGQSRSQSGPLLGARSITASSSVGLDSSGAGYYDQYTSVGH